MRLPAVVFALFALLVAFPANAETFKTPNALIKALYSGKVDNRPEALTLYTAYFSDKLLGRFRADRKATPDGEVGALDFDPVISGQDGEATNLDIGQPIILDNTAELEVSFTNGEPVTLYYTLVKEHGGWKVDDIANQQGEYPWSLSAIFDGENK